MKSLSSMLCFLILGCSAVTDTGRHTSGESVPPERFCIDYAEALCEANERCCDAPVDPTMCRALILMECGELDDVLGDPITGYDARAAGAYLAQARMLASSCDPSAVALFEPRSFLSAFLAGTVAQGGPCTPRTLLPPDTAVFISCEEGLSCTFNAGIYTCEPVQGEGAACLSSLQCRDDLTCIGAVGVMPGACSPPFPNGTACTSNGDCASLRCASTGVCEDASVDSLYCGADRG